MLGNSRVEQPLQKATQLHGVIGDKYSIHPASAMQKHSLIVIFHLVVLVFFILVHGVSIVWIIHQELQRGVKHLQHTGSRLVWGVLNKGFQRLQAELPELVITLSSAVTESYDQGDD